MRPKNPTDTDIWNNFPSHSIPSMFNYGNIVQYIIESVDKIRLPNENQDSSDEEDDTVTDMPMKKGRGLFASGFVENVQDSVSDIGNILSAVTFIIR